MAMFVEDVRNLTSEFGLHLPNFGDEDQIDDLDPVLDSKLPPDPMAKHCFACLAYRKYHRLISGKAETQGNEHGNHDSLMYEEYIPDRLPRFAESQLLMEEERRGKEEEV